MQEVLDGNWKFCREKHTIFLNFQEKENYIRDLKKTEAGIGNVLGVCPKYMFGLHVFGNCLQEKLKKSNIIIDCTINF
jgi:hypothetical protein